MADSRADAGITVGADDSSFQATMANVQKTVQDAMGKVGGHVSGLSGVLEKVTGKFAAFAAIVGGGAAFGAAISETKKFTGEVVTLSKQLGISTEEASGLNVALGDIGSDADQYTGALQKLTKQVRTNEAGLNAMGIATRDANGQYLNGRALMDSALTGLKSYKEGTDRNLAAQVAFGKGAAESAALLKLNNDVQEEGAKKARELNLVVGTENVAAVKAYKAAMNDVGDVLQAIQITIGSAVMPVLTKLGVWFSEGGPAAVAVFKPLMQGVADVLSIVADAFIELWDIAKSALTSIGAAFVDSEVGVKSFGEFITNVFTIIQVVLLTFKAGLVVTFEVMRGAIEVIVAQLTGFANVAAAAFRLDWGGVKSAWSAGVAGVEKVVADSAKRIYDKTMASGQAIADALAGGTKMPAPAAPAKVGGGRSFVDPSAGASKAGRLEDTSKAEYAVAKAQFEAVLNLQKQYLSEVQAGYDDAYKKNLIGIREYYTDRIGIEQAAISMEMATKQKEIEATQAAQATATTDRERLTLKAQEIKLTGELTVMTARYAQVVVTETRAMTEAERQRAAGLREVQIASQVNIGNSQLAMDRIALDTRRQLRQVSNADALQEEKGFEDRITAIQRQALTDRLALEKAGTNDPVRIASINAQIEDLERQHQIAITQIEAQATVERNKYAQQASDAVRGNFETFFSDLTDRSKKLSDTLKNLFSNLAKSLNDVAAKRLTEQLFGAGSKGGGMLDGILGQIFPAAAGAGAPRGGTGGGSTAEMDAAGAISMLGSQATATSGAMAGLSQNGIGGMFKSAGDWITKTLFGTVAQEAQTSAAATLTSALAAASTAVYGFTSALSSASVSSAAGGASGGSGGTGGIFGSILGSGSASGSFGDWWTSLGGAAMATGTDFVPRDMLALIHRGERIVPASQNKASSGPSIGKIEVNVPSGTNTASASQIGAEVGGRTQAALARNS